MNCGKPPRWLKALLFWSAVLWIGSATGCATIISGSTKEIGVTSHPSGAKVTVDGGSTQITTPGKVILKRDSNHVLLFAMDGHESQTVSVDKKLNGWVFGNLVFGGIFGLVIDIVSGSVNDLKPDKAHVDFAPQAPIAAVAAPPAQAPVPKQSRATLLGGASP